MTGKWRGWHTIGLMVIPLAIVLVGIVIPKERPLLLWLLTLGVMILIPLIAGHGKTGRFWFGWLINEQNRISLSRLQMFLWTFIVLSAFLAAIIINLKVGRHIDAVAITLPEELLIAMGISTTSLVGSPLLLTEKEKRIENRKMEFLERRIELTELEDKLSKDRSDKGGASDVFSRLEKSVFSRLEKSVPDLDHPTKAHLHNLVSGENTDNKDMLDLTRLQNLFFTLILVGGYAVSLGSVLVSTSPILAFPEIGASSVTLLGISHVGYLAGKART